MPWCENPECGKRDLKKADVVFDDLRQQVLCVPCGQVLAAQGGGDALHGEVVEKTWFGIGYSTDQGLKAELVYGGAKLAVKVDNDQIMRFLGT